MMDGSAPIPSIKVFVRRMWSGMVIEAAGDLDMTTVSAFEEHYKSAQSHLQRVSESQTLILDLRKITFVDSAGLAFLVRISQDMIGSQHRFSVVVREHGQPERVIKLGHFDKILNVMYHIDDGG